MLLAMGFLSIGTKRMPISDYGIAVVDSGLMSSEELAALRVSIMLMLCILV